MKIYSNKTVLEAAKERIKFLFEDFENVVVSYSGGKDSTVILGLCLEVARELDRLPLKVMFLDQESELAATIEIVQEVMNSEEIEPLWLQVPIKISNGTSQKQSWIQCWKEGDEWQREKSPISIKENIYGTDRFYQFFTNFFAVEYPNTKSCYIAGVRCEESPQRALGLTSDLTYKHITWGKKVNPQKGHYTFYPIYDWSYTDVWKYINDENLSYNKAYDYMYQYGIPITAMRVSSLHHETAIHSLFYLQEAEPDTWNNLVKRLDGINTAGRLDKAGFQMPKDLPYMFESWEEYRDHLLENLIQFEDKKEIYKRTFKSQDEKYHYPEIRKYVIKAQIRTLLFNDYHFTKMQASLTRPEVYAFVKFMKKGVLPTKKNKYVRAYEQRIEREKQEYS